MIGDCRILAGIVLFNPDVGRLIENINAILPQVDCLLLVENGSRDLSYRKILKSQFQNVLYVKNDKSMGIAYALNQILGYAYSNGYEWAITLDQDSVVADGIIDVYRQKADDSIGILGCLAIDRNFNYNVDLIGKRTDEDVDWLISSASFTNVKAWYDCGGFDTGMFIDWVDWEIGESMRKHGYRIVRTYKTYVLHELGIDTKIVRFRRHLVHVSNYPSFRYYYSSRNRIYMARKYKKICLGEQIKEIFIKIIVVARYEKHLLSNIWAFAKGMIAGAMLPINKNSIDDDLLKVKTAAV